MRLMKYMQIVVLIVAVGTFLFQTSGRDIPEWWWFLELIIFAPALLYLIYFLSFGRKKYLSLKKDKDSIFNS
jgi:hypothetical protein